MLSRTHFLASLSSLLLIGALLFTLSAPTQATRSVQGKALETSPSISSKDILKFTEAAVKQSLTLDTATLTTQIKNNELIFNHDGKDSYKTMLSQRGLLTKQNKKDDFKSVVYFISPTRLIINIPLADGGVVAHIESHVQVVYTDINEEIVKKEFGRVSTIVSTRPDGTHMLEDIIFTKADY